MMDDVQRYFVEQLSRHQIQLNEQQLHQFQLYYEELVTWNEKMNLTAITEREQVYMKHFYDSLSIAFFFSFSSLKTVADIGSGAGFPSVPLKIVFPHLQVTIIDSLQKRIRFINHLAEQLQLSDVQAIHSRAEDAGRQPHLRDRFDVVTARAVARLNVLNELCLPFVKTGGVFIAMKGADTEEEIAEAQFSLAQLRATIKDTHPFVLPTDQSSRQLIIIEKLAATPRKYPRKAGTPAKSPL